MGFAHATGGVLGGVVVAGGLWLIITPLRTLAPVAVQVLLFAGLATAAALADTNVIGLPRQRRQVPQSWFGRYGAVRSYALYGLWLGAALGTNITYMVELVVLAGAALLLPLAGALAVGVAFGLGRTAPVAPLGASLRAADWWGRVVYDGESRVALRLSAMLSIATGALAITHLIP
jgi:hypothetical protein